jgi:hypothetical protein
MILVLTWLESDPELNTKVIEYFLRCPMVIFTPWYAKQFRSMILLKLAGLLKFCSGQN